MTGLFEWLCACVCGSHGLPPTCLDDELGTLVARKQCHVDSAAFHIGAVLIHYGIKLCMAHWKGGVWVEGGGVWHVMTLLRQQWVTLYLDTFSHQGPRAWIVVHLTPKSSLFD